MLMSVLRVLMRFGRVFFSFSMIALVVVLGRCMMCFSSMLMMLSRFLVMFLGHIMYLPSVASHSEPISRYLIQFNEWMRHY